MLCHNLSGLDNRLTFEGIPAAVGKLVNLVSFVSVCVCLCVHMYIHLLTYLHLLPSPSSLPLPLLPPPPPSQEHFVAPRNCLECIPDGLARCYKLKRLILSSNQLLTLPEGLYFLGELKVHCEDLRFKDGGCCLLLRSEAWHYSVF